MKKRGASKILEIILIILMIFAMIILLYNLFRFHIKDQGEVGEAKMQLMTEETDIDKVEGNLTYATNISITITKGPGRIIIRNVTIVNHTVNADVFSVADLSGSMTAGCDYLDCWTNQSICESSRCGGTWVQDYQTCSVSCNNNKTTCESGCNGIWNSTWNICSYYTSPNTCYFNQTNCENRCGGSWIWAYTCKNSHDSCPSNPNEENCTNLCGGVWADKIGQTKIANKAFVENVLNISGNRVGLVGYATIANESDYHPLSNDTASLKSTIDSWPLRGLTCICCGINRAVADLNISGNNFKAIVLMSDGQANINCSASKTNQYEAAILDAINAAKDAYEKYGIRVYTIGFGSDADTSTLRNMSEKGGGKYYFSDVSHLSEIYDQIYQEIVRNYEEAEKWDHLKIMFYNDTDSYEYKLLNPPLPLETKTYVIPDSDELFKHITNITKIEIFPVIYTQSGKQVIGPPLDRWEAKYG